ncbi:uncharacterized protein LOC106733613 isoform X4 [Tupaia chinensis]|uniref:uncharacterized protein LOC106733613 isoform X4 n=1 Tax=Tupaia chinensis TaxID=246437 RepID=UPI000FFBE419|nr:uncharacterized protein LOC106733613 isoform X4 [Tupaia chinensis]
MWAGRQGRPRPPLSWKKAGKSRRPVIRRMDPQAETRDPRDWCPRSWAVDPLHLPEDDGQLSQSESKRLYKARGRPGGPGDRPAVGVDTAAGHGHRL